MILPPSRRNEAKPTTTILCIFETVSLAKIVGCAEIDDSCHSIDFNAGNKTAATSRRVAQIAATVFPLVVLQTPSLLSRHLKQSVRARGSRAYMVKIPPRFRG